MIDVIIVEDESAIARGLTQLITQYHPGFQVISVCKNGEEGAQKIIELKPDLVFTDINMPVMNGLDMIKQVQSFTPHTHYIILTGYAEFEYAHTAMNLGITDYLLKPISPITLNKIMQSAREKYLDKIKARQKKYLAFCLNNEQQEENGNNPLQGYSCTLFVLFSGPISSNIYSENMITNEFFLPDQAKIQMLESKFEVWIYSFHGHHSNEYIYAIVSPVDHEPILETLAEELYQHCHVVDSYINLFISFTSQNGKGIYDLIRNTYLFALFQVGFGQSCIRHLEITENKPLHISEEIRQICAGISRHSSKEKFIALIRSIIFYWEQSEISQLQLITDLRYFISTVIHHYSDNNTGYPDAVEIISACSSYQDLEQELQYELEKICGFEQPSISESQHKLAKQIKDYLDKNFTAQITYKNFQDVFSYNEKYLSVLFKEEYGISPSKYIGQLRLDMAKKIMHSMPEILLKDVAEMSGFTDAFYFSKVFKAHEGISPSEYIKKIKKTSV